MLYFAVGFGMLLNILFWGTGLSWLIVPRPYRRYWPFFVAPAGVALQSAVVWAGAYANLAGTNCYARWTMVLPAVLLAWGLSDGSRRRRLRRDLKQAGGVALAMAFALGLMLRPLTTASAALTTASLGSCDAADYAAGARVLKEFARSDRTGFIGHTEVVRVHSVDNFFDFWLRLNHFTPSALVAFNGSVFRRQPHELVGLTAPVLLVLVMPLVFWLARAGLRLGPVASAAVTLLYGLAPVNLYAVYHVALGQLLAAAAVALLTWVGIAVWREGAIWRRAPAWAGVLFITYWLILGSYNFIVTVCLIPAFALAGGIAVWRDDWRMLVRWLVTLLAPLALCSVVFAQRFLGLLERFRLFQQYDFGWKIPAFSPEEWWGFLRGPGLEAYGPRLRLLLSLLLLGMLAWALFRAARRRSVTPWVVVCLTVPVLLGYAFLEVRGAIKGTNASYDAYKLFSVFYPGILAALCYWFTLGARGASRPARAAVLLLGTLVLWGNVAGARQFLRRMQNPPLIVDSSLVDLQRIERLSQVDSINMVIPDFWSRIWANAFLLRKPQYFSLHTYEARLNTALKGGWDLHGGVIDVVPAQPGGLFVVNPYYTLVDTRSPTFLRAEFNTGWYELEQLPREPVRWRWSRGDAQVQIDNPQSYTLVVRCRLDVRSLVDRDLQIWLGDHLVVSKAIGTNRETIWLPDFTVPPGRSAVQFRSPQPAVTPGPGDSRLLGVAAYEIELHVRRTGDPEPPGSGT
jgi:hypothetical protein